MRLHDICANEKALESWKLIVLGSPCVPLGRPALPHNKPEAIALKLRHLPDAVQKTLRPAARCLGLDPSALHRGRKQVEQILSAQPCAKEWSTATPDDEAYLLGRLRIAKEGPIRVAMYCFTMPGFAEALVELHRQKIEVRVLIDDTWAKSKIQALECIEMLLKAGVVVKHFGYISMHIKLLIIGTIFCSFGSPNLSWAAFHNNIELLVKLVGGGVDTLDASELFDQLYFKDDRAKIADLKTVQAQVEKLKEKAKKRNVWASS